MPVQVPVTILTGVSASSPAQLISRILNEPHGHRVAMICHARGLQNGEARFDPAINGCVACYTDDRGRALGELTARIADADVKIERLIFDAVGLDARALCELFLEERVASSTLMPDVVVATLDIEAISASDERESMITTLIEQADVVLIVAVGNVSAHRARCVIEQIMVWNHKAKIRFLTAGAIPLASLINLSAHLEQQEVGAFPGG